MYRSGTLITGEAVCLGWWGGGWEISVPSLNFAVNLKPLKKKNQTIKKKKRTRKKAVGFEFQRNHSISSPTSTKNNHYLLRMHILTEHSVFYLVILPGFKPSFLYFFITLHWTGTSVLSSVTLKLSWTHGYKTSCKDPDINKKSQALLFFSLFIEHWFPRACYVSFLSRGGAFFAWGVLVGV